MKKIGFIMCAAVVLSSCSERTESKLEQDTHTAGQTNVSSMTTDDEKSNNDRSVTASTSSYAQALAGSTKDSQSMHAQVVDDDVDKYKAFLEEMITLDDLFAHPPTQSLTYAYVSNLVADISPVYLMNRTMREYEGGRRKTTPKQRLIMLLFEVIMNRDDAVPSARMVARYKMSDYYTYHDNRQFPPQYHHPYALKLLEEAKLSDEANIHEKRTFGSMQVRLCSIYCSSEPEKTQAQIRKVEKMAEEGFPIPEQPLLIMPLVEAQALLELDREKEARELVQDLYDRLDTIDDFIIRGELSAGVDAWFRRQKGEFDHD